MLVLVSAIGFWLVWGPQRASDSALESHLTLPRLADTRPVSDPSAPVPPDSPTHQSMDAWCAFHCRRLAALSAKRAVATLGQQPFLEAQRARDEYAAALYCQGPCPEI